MTERTLGIGLFVSIVLNVFLAAAFVGALGLAGYVARHPAAPAMRQAAHSLDSTHRAAFMSLLHDQGSAVRPINRQARALRLEVWQAMQGQAFDPAAAKLKLAQARTQTIAARARVEDAVVDFAASLPTDQRIALGRALERAMPRGRAAGSKGVGAPS
ncbi:MAG TPA: periplasmic heavy metal sensor [Caulobacteraceae bacterium]|jgi:uncharacterized membrane protein|nr:periplasmic heavy metal sensor [Caulobacteraceae bacterium]